MSWKNAFGRLFEAQRIYCRDIIIPSWAATFLGCVQELFLPVWRRLKVSNLTSISPILGSALVLWLPFSLRSLHAGHEICVFIQILPLQYKILFWGRGLFLSDTLVAHLPLFTILSSRLPTSDDFSSDVHDERSLISFQITSQVALHYLRCEYQTFVNTPVMPNNSTLCYSSLTLEQETRCP